jgi:xanthine dehydrogenase accessory factor
MGSIEEEILKALSDNLSVSLATVIDYAGSTPRAVGAQMLVRVDGSSTGTIGGGSVEAEVARQAVGVIETGEARTVHFELTNRDVAEEGSICGGDVSIFLEPLPAARPDLSEIYKTVVGIKKRGGSALLVTIISVDDAHPPDDRSKVLIDREGRVVGSLMDDPRLLEKATTEIDRVLRRNRPEILALERNGKQVKVLLEPIISDPTVYIFGGGHIGACLAPLAKGVGFRVVVCDDRSEFANRERFPDADEVVVEEFNGLLEKLPIDENAYLVLVTRGHLHDRTVLEQAVRAPARYVGMIGSRRKIKMVYQSLKKEGVPEERLMAVRAPIGLDIGAETPEEIAVSILAELIKVRARPDFS